MYKKDVPELIFIKGFQSLLQNPENAALLAQISMAVIGELVNGEWFPDPRDEPN